MALALKAEILCIFGLQSMKNGMSFVLHNLALKMVTRFLSDGSISVYCETQMNTNKLPVRFYFQGLLPHTIAKFFANTRHMYLWLPLLNLSYSSNRSKSISDLIYSCSNFANVLQLIFFHILPSRIIAVLPLVPRPQPIMHHAPCTSFVSKR